MILSASFLDCLFLHFLKFFSQVTITYYYCQVCARPLWLALGLLFCPFLPCFRFEYVYLYALCVCMYFCVLMCVFCVFPFEWNILCCIYAIYCTFYRTYVLLLQYLALYGIICLQLNSGYVKTALICPRKPILVFLAFFSFPILSGPVNPPQGYFFACGTVWENSGHLTRRQVRRPSVPLTPFSMPHGYPVPKRRILRQGGGGGRGAVGDEPTDRAPPLLPCSAIDRQHQIPQLFPPTVAKDAVLLIVAVILGQSESALHATLRSVSIKSPLWCSPLIMRAFRRPLPPVSGYG